MSSSKRNRFEGVARGEPLCGSKAVAGHVWNDEKKWRSAFRLPRDEFGLAVVCGELLGYVGWIDFALATGAERRRPRKANAA
jgi:hypothetical protein